MALSVQAIAASRCARPRGGQRQEQVQTRNATNVKENQAHASCCVDQFKMSSCSTPLARSAPGKRNLVSYSVTVPSCGNT